MTELPQACRLFVLTIVTRRDYTDVWKAAIQKGSAFRLCNPINLIVGLFFYSEYSHIEHLDVRHRIRFENAMFLGKSRITFPALWGLSLFRVVRPARPQSFDG